MGPRWNISRFLGSSRGPTLDLNIGRANATPFRPKDPISHLVRDLDRVLHNPDPDQLAETLKVVLMTHGCSEALPVHYNSCILHVLEEYHDMRRALGSKTQQLEDAKRESELAKSKLKEKRLLWDQKEIDYKAEIKKLEGILARGEQGLELVTLARSNTALRRAKRAAEAKTRYKDQIGHDDDVGATTVAGSSSRKEIMLPDFAARQDSHMSRKFMTPVEMAEISQSPTFGFPKAREQQHCYAEVVAEVSGDVLPKTLPVENPTGKENALGVSDGVVSPTKASRFQRLRAHTSSSNKHPVSADGLLPEQGQKTSRRTRYFNALRKGRSWSNFSTVFRGNSRQSIAQVEGRSWSNFSTVFRGNSRQSIAQVEHPQAESDTRQKNTVGDIEAALTTARRR